MVYHSPLHPGGTAGGARSAHPEGPPRDPTPSADDVWAAPSLDPTDWDALRAQGHGMLDDMIDYLQGLRERPVWRPIPAAVREHFCRPAPVDGTPLAQVHRQFMDRVPPYALGNTHPGFMGWVHGGGTAVGMLAEMLAGGLNANLGGRDHMPLYVERQVEQWVREWFGLPPAARGLFVTGTSMGNFVGVLAARTAALGQEVRTQGLAAGSGALRAYASASAHGSIARALDMAGIGSATLRRIPLDAARRMDSAALAQAVAADRAAGLRPFLVAATVGSVDTGAIDDLQAAADTARRAGAWFHVDGAYGALAILAPELAPRLKGIEQADSLAFDFHKWGQVPYDAGFVMARDGAALERSFAAPAHYLQRDTRGMAAGAPWPCDLGPDLSRGFRALKTWFTLMVYGTAALGRTIQNTCTLAQHLRRRIAAEPRLELLAPVTLNIVCFGYRCGDPDRINARIVTALHEQGLPAPSTTVIDGRLAIRAAIVNHRTGTAEVDRLVAAAAALGDRFTSSGRDA